MDSGAEPVIIDQWLAQELGLNATDFEPSPFTIVTSRGGTERTTGYTKHLLELIFSLGSGPLYSHLSLQFSLTSATDYDILVGQQVLYTLGLKI